MDFSIGVLIKPLKKFWDFIRYNLNEVKVELSKIEINEMEWSVYFSINFCNNTGVDMYVKNIRIYTVEDNGDFKYCNVFHIDDIVFNDNKRHEVWKDFSSCMINARSICTEKLGIDITKDMIEDKEVYFEYENHKGKNTRLKLNNNSIS